MDPTSYRRQTRSLRAYRTIAQIPRDPYDMFARVAKQLLAYQRTIVPTAEQQRIYNQAMARSPEHGPCCCHWRWEAMEGLSKHLISRRHWPAARLASLIGDLDGCGGKRDSEHSA